MVKIVRLTESDLTRIVEKVINEQSGRQIASALSSPEPESSPAPERPLANKSVLFYMDIQQTKKYAYFRIGDRGVYPSNKPGVVILNGVGNGGLNVGGRPSGSGNLLIEFNCNSSTFRTERNPTPFYNRKLAVHLKGSACSVPRKASTPKTDF
jgi:hypothetical protein